MSFKNEKKNFLEKQVIKIKEEEKHRHIEI